MQILYHKFLQHCKQKNKNLRHAVIECCLHSAKIEIKKKKETEKKAFTGFYAKWQKEWEQIETEKKSSDFYPFLVAQRNQNQKEEMRNDANFTDFRTVIRGTFSVGIVRNTLRAKPRPVCMEYRTAAAAAAGIFGASLQAGRVTGKIKKPTLSKKEKGRLQLFLIKFFVGFLLGVDSGSFPDAVVSAEKAALLFAKVERRSAVVGRAVIFPTMSAFQTAMFCHLTPRNIVSVRPARREARAAQSKWRYPPRRL